jgi:DNA-binding MarR family transcriptional regulator
MEEPSSSSRFTDPEPLIGALLRMPWEVVRRRMLDHLHRRGFDDLDAAHLTVLQYPGPDGARPSELAGRLGMTKQALNYLLGELERLGYLVRSADPDDLRSKRVTLTPRGHAAAKAMRAAVRAQEREWAKELGPERFGVLRRLLVDLNHLP